VQLACEEQGQELLCSLTPGHGDTGGVGVDFSQPYGAVGEPEYIVAQWQAATYNAVHLLHLGVFLTLPLFMELWLEFELRRAIFGLVRDFFMLSWFFFLFTMQTKAFHFAFGLTHGRSSYVATGRGYAMESHSVVQLYGLYAQSHIYLGMEIMVLLILYALFALDIVVYVISTWAVWMTALSLTFAPWIFNPQGWTLEVVSSSFFEWLLWIDSTSLQEGVPGKGSWQAFHDDRMAMLRSKSFCSKAAILAVDAMPRTLLAVAALTSTALKAHTDSAGVERVQINTAYDLGVKFGAVGLSLLLMFGASLLYPATWAVFNTACRGAVSSRSLALILSVVGGTALYLYACYAVLDQHLGLIVIWDGSRLTTSTGLLAIATIAAWSFLIECFGAVAPAPNPQVVDPATDGPRTSGVPAGSSGLSALARRAAHGYADPWWRALDVLYGGFIFAALLLFTALPLAAMQGVLLYNIDFTRVLAERNRRRRILAKLIQ